HGFRAAAQIGLVQAALDPALAVGQLPTYDGFHSKLLGGGGRERGGTPSQTTKNAGGFRVFSCLGRSGPAGVRFLKDQSSDSFLPGSNRTIRMSCRTHLVLEPSGRTFRSSDEMRRGAQIPSRVRLISWSRCEWYTTPR